jgi:molecular chaperone DnaK
MAIIGIDLGTSDSSAAVMRGGRPIIVPSAGGVTLGGKAFPSYVGSVSRRAIPDGRAAPS